jgi:hypothetical protein
VRVVPGSCLPVCSRARWPEHCVSGLLQQRCSSLLCVVRGTAACGCVLMPAGLHAVCRTACMICYAARKLVESLVPPAVLQTQHPFGVSHAACGGGSRGDCRMPWAQLGERNSALGAAYAWQLYNTCVNVRWLHSSCSGRAFTFMHRHWSWYSCRL